MGHGLSADAPAEAQKEVLDSNTAQPSCSNSSKGVTVAEVGHRKHSDCSLDLASTTANSPRSTQPDPDFDGQRSSFEFEMSGLKGPEVRRMRSHVGGHAYDLDQLEELGTLGSGTFGEVLLVGSFEVSDDLKGGPRAGSLFALKTVWRERLAQANIPDSAKVERAVLIATDSAFLVRLAASYESPHYSYLLLEVALGGDLHYLYQRGGFFGSQPHARFYSACVLLALEHLHERRILYRDVKMENLVLDLQGYGKLCDFGTSSFNFDRSFTVCGTPEYMAPEVADGSGTTCAADWWSLGVLICELLQGHSPFLADEPSEMFAKARAGIDAVAFPSDDFSWPSLVQALCRQTPEERLAMLPGGTANVRTHAWFVEEGFDWQALERLELPAPHEPALEERWGSLLGDFMD